MKNKGLIFSGIAVFLFAINFISAASFSIGSFFDQIGAENLILITVFLILLAFVNFALKKSLMKDSPAIAGVISLCVALLATYGLYVSNFDLTGLMFNFGVTQDIIITWVPIIFLLAIIFFSIKYHISTVMTIVGAIFIALSQTSLVYETGFFGWVGAVLLILGGIWWIYRSKNKKKPLDLRIR